MRKTKITCTLGPASSDYETIKRMMEAGMNVARINFSHGGGKEQSERVNLVRRLRRELNLPVSLLLDNKGPEIRIGTFENTKIELNDGDIFTLYHDMCIGNKKGVYISYESLYTDINIGNTILIDDGLVNLEVIDIKNKDIICKTIVGGKLSNNKSVNVPNVKINLPSITDKDIEDIKYGCENEFDYIAASFVRKKEDVLAIRSLLKEYNNDHIKIISKIENREGIDNFDEILEVSDGIMVARGDLGVEIAYEEVPVVQKELIKKTFKAGKIVITATQMLESMVHNPAPTRAEVSDVANAIYDGTSAIMLSEEAAVGDYPVECIKVMDRIATNVECKLKYWKRFTNREMNSQDFEFIIDHAMCVSAMNTKAKYIACYTKTTDTPAIVSSFRPNIPTIGITKDLRKFNQMGLFWGVRPYYYKGDKEGTHEIVIDSLEQLKEQGEVKSGDIIITAGGRYTYSYESKINKSIGGIYQI